MCVTQASITSPADARREIFPAAVLLHAAAAEDGICFALLIRVEPGYAENNRLVHPRDQRDIAHAPVLDSERTLVFRYYAAHAAEVNMEIVLAVAQHGSASSGVPLLHASLSSVGELRIRAFCAVGSSVPSGLKQVIVCSVLSRRRVRRRADRFENMRNFAPAVYKM